jgi:hypothetical protein
MYLFIPAIDKLPEPLHCVLIAYIIAQSSELRCVKLIVEIKRQMSIRCGYQ